MTAAGLALSAVKNYAAEFADQKKRVAILQQAGKHIMDEALFVPLYNLADIYGLARNLIWNIRPDEKVMAKDMTIKG